MIIVYSAESTATTISNNLQTYLWHFVYIYMSWLLCTVLRVLLQQWATTYKHICDILWRWAMHQQWTIRTIELCRLFLLKWLVANLKFREGFRRASAITAAASANASSKQLLPRASAVPFFWYFFQYRFREHSASFREACGKWMLIYGEAILLSKQILGA